MPVFLGAIGLLCAAAITLVAWRQVLLRQSIPQHHHEPFDGVLYRVGRATVAERRSAQPKDTVVAMHGFLEDMRYFTDLYSDPDVQLIALTSADYHVPVTDPVLVDPPWAHEPDAVPGTIAYDAAVLVQALEHLPKTRDVRVHGHSRGGAVVLEAARTRPDLFRDVGVVLEAPVLPQGKLYAAISPILLWLYPFVIPGWRRDPLARRFARAYGAMTNARKRTLLEGLPHTPKRIGLFITNIEDLLTWMATRDASVYRNVGRGTVLVPAGDRVLDAQAMLASAERGKPELDVVWLDPDVSHFVALDAPERIPAVGSAPVPRESRALERRSHEKR